MEQDLQQFLLENLKPSRAPEAISWWPPAIGWWVLLLLVLGALIAVGIIVYMNYRKDAYRRDAIALAQRIYKQYRKDKNSAKYLSEMSQLLHRIVQQITHDNHATEPPQNTRARWISMLNAHSEEPLSEPAAIALSEQLYQPSPEVDVPILHQELSNWIQTHERVVRG